ncbi:MAG: hypothetical protein ABIH23_24920 [bacterium]
MNVISAQKESQHYVLTLLVCGLLMALGWGINGMLGYAPGASVPGAFIAMAVAGILGLTRDDRQGTSANHSLVRLAAFGAMGYWFGGEMTYGRTFALTKADFAGGEYYWWGMLGVAIKGAVWHGVGAVCIGLGLVYKRYRWKEMALLMAAMTVASMAGILLLNRPLGSPDSLPLICFSYDPTNPQHYPRSESWAGLWAGLIVLLVYAGMIKKDRVTVRFGLFGILGGGLGFPIGQMVQASSWSHNGFGLGPWVDWWKVMEMTHGFIGGVSIALAALLTRREEIHIEGPEDKSFSPVVEWTGIAIWGLIVVGYFLRSEPNTHFLAVFPFVGGILVFAGLTAGRWWPWFIVGVQTPVATGLVACTDAMHHFPEDAYVRDFPILPGDMMTDALNLLPKTGGWGTPEREILTLLDMLSYAWPMVVISFLVCAVPTWIWLYGRSPQANRSLSIIQLFVGYHVVAVFIQMVWATLRFAKSCGAMDLFLEARFFITLTTVYLMCWYVTMTWFPGQQHSSSTTQSAEL